MKYIFLAILVCPFFAWGQAATEEAEEMDKEELLLEVESTIEQLNSIIQLSNFQISLSAVEEGEFDKDDSKYFQKLPRFENPEQEAIGEFLNEVQFSQRILYPYNILSLSVDFYDYGNALGQGSRFLYDNESFIPSFKIKRITYKGGEEVALTKDMYIDKEEILARNADFDAYEVSDIEEVLLESDYGSTTIALNDPRPVEKVDVAIVVKFLPSKLVYLKEAGDIIQSDFGEVVLEQKQEGYLTLRYPIALDDLLTPYAIYEDGRGLNQLNSNSITITSEEKLQEYEGQTHLKS